MNLLLDIGNTRTKWALVDSAGLIVERGFVTAGEERTLATPIGQAIGRETIGSVLVCSVGASIRREGVMDLILTKYGVQPVLLATELARCGLRNGYDDPRTLGVDRWLAMLGAWCDARRACLVVDVGTAMTVDAVSGEGNHLGGYIIPGLRLQRGALEVGTADVRGGGRDVAFGLGRRTSEAVSNGILASLAGLIERAKVEVELMLDDTCEVFVTGGDAEAVAAGLKMTVRRDPDLVFRGMLAYLDDRAH